MRRTLAHALLAQATLNAAPALATPPSEARGVVVRGDRVERDRARVEGGTRFATSVDLRERARLAESVADVLDEAPGLHARRSGDGLAPTAVSLRGAPAAHVTLALDGVVLNDAASDGVDLSLLPPSLLERVDVYRGPAPVRLGLAGLGGAVELITRAPGPRPAAWVAGGYGSFGQRRLGAMVQARAGAVHALLAVGHRGTRGDFAFYDDHGTALDPSDDRVSQRVNNAADALDVLGRACVGPPRGQACALVVFGWRERGLPGPGASQLATPSLAQARLLGRAWYRAPLGAGRLEPYVSAIVRRDHFRDYLGEAVAGVAIDARGVGSALEAGALAEIVSGPVRLEPVARARLEAFGATGGAAGPAAVVDASRASGLAGLDARVTLGALDLAPAFAAELVGDAAAGREGLTRLLLSPRLGARLALGPHLELRANAAHLARAPTLPELFGAGGYLVGNPALRPEVSDGVDAGAVVTLRGRGLQTRLEAAGFARSARDLIVLLRSGVVSLRPDNLRGAEIFGLELGARLAHRRAFALSASYAYTSATTRAGAAAAEGRRVPAIPEHDLYARAEAAAGPLGAWLEASYVSGIYYDVANLSAAPPRLLLGAAVAFTPPFARGVTFAVQGSNLLDQRDGAVAVRAGPGYLVRQPVSDFAGYPLPGRAVFATLSLGTERGPR